MPAHSVSLAARHADASPDHDTGSTIGVDHADWAAFRVPHGAWDCHAHVFEQEARFPFAADRTFTPGHASLQRLRDFRRDLGFSRTVIVQASVYGADNRLMLDVLQREGGTARGIAVIDARHTDRDLRRMADLGVRGVRLNLETFGVDDPVQARDRLRTLAERVAPLGWHVQLYVGAHMLAPLADTLAGLPCPAVIDHFACLQARLGGRQPGFDALQALLRDGNVWLKMSAPSRTGRTPDHLDLQPLVEALIDAGPHRIVWGSDWPHTGGTPKAQRAPDVVEPFATIDDRRNAWQLNRWLPAALRDAVWIDNPARLYA